jgi:O-antigen/teichoic acid export membrane protein
LWDAEALQRLFGKGCVLGLAGVFVMLMMQGGLLLYRFEDDIGPQLGQLVLASQVLALMLTLPGALAAVAMPVLSRLVARGDGRQGLFVDVMIRIGIIVGVVVALVLCAVGPTALPYVFGDAYARAGELAGPIAFVLIPATCGSVLGQAGMLHGRIAVLPLAAATGCTVLVAVFLASVEMLGVLAPIVATGIGMAVWVTVLLLSLRADLPPGIVRVTGRSCMAAAAAAFVFFLCASQALSPALCLALSMGTLVAFGTALKLLRPSEWRALRAWCSRR